MKTEFEHIVVGLGGIGSGVAYWLARRAGSEVLGLEQFELGHERGASQDHSRIIRLSYHTPGYVRLAQAAYETWAELEEDAGERLIVTTGGLDLWPEGAAIPMSSYSDSLRSCDVAFEKLDAGEIMRRWPQWRLPDDVLAIFQPDAGIAPAARCNATHRLMAVEHGATLLDQTPVVAIRCLSDSIEVETAAEQVFRCQKIVLAVDAWTNDFLTRDLGPRLPLTVTEEQVTYFAAPDPAAFDPGRFPIWIWMDDPSFYGFPAFGEAGPKAAQDCGGDPVTPRTRTNRPNPKTTRRLQEFMQRYLPSALGPEIVTKTCMYTLTPDRDFVIDRLPGRPNVFVALGAAHGFKFASLFGQVLSDLAVDGRTSVDLEPFRIDRPILQMENPPTSWMI
jgi:sarcosine oxidase